LNVRKCVLTIAGSDPTGGAGIQGDLRTLCALGIHPLSVVTAITVQGTRGVRAVHPVEASIVRAQLDVILEDVRVDVVKTGALANAAIVNEVADALAPRRLPLVIDPGIVSSSGARLLDDAGVCVLLDRLIPLATLVTPNVAELRLLLGDDREAKDEGDLARAAERLRARGARAVLAKGGHLPGDPTDVLVDESGVRSFSGTRIETSCTHGTGCTLASAIAGALAQGRSLEAAVELARSLVREAMQRAVPIGEGKSPLDPFARK
jgi:hydroxymethylpyrimidine/phosphomethylpyrimidine kinase